MISKTRRNRHVFNASRDRAADHGGSLALAPALALDLLLDRLPPSRPRAIVRLLQRKRWKYKLAARYLLRKEGIPNPTEKELKEKVHYLHTNRFRLIRQARNLLARDPDRFAVVRSLLDADCPDCC